MFKKILVGLDGSDAARHALEQALALAVLTSGSVHAVSVEEQLPAYAATVGEVQEEERFQDHYYRRVHSDARRLAEASRVPFSHEIVPGHAARALIERATAGAFDLIVLGHTGHSRLYALFLGSTTIRVAERAPCPVLVVR
jgi:nucleotide-binding universal stress UspA family protein